MSGGWKGLRTDALQEARRRRENPSPQVLTLDEYQEAAKATALYPGSGTGSYDALAYCALGLGEVGELQGKVKKIWRDDHRDDDAMIAELGDILWYISAFAMELDVPLSEVAARNLAKLADRADRGVIGGAGDER